MIDTTWRRDWQRGWPIGDVLLLFPAGGSPISASGLPYSIQTDYVSDVKL
jgi:hypothetical protein